MQSCADLKVGEKVQIVGYQAGQEAYRRQLMALGLLPGTELSIIRIAPLGCPIQINVRGTRIGLRRKEADLLKLTRVSDEV